ncbi:hypothetical protein [Alteribacillus sp. HJP-4]|uniref:hypothetical protein n=1 Tax=Alteribacillus sp. HJP-4 TaxID=2775394 RepID=UPI0035CD1852
MDKLKRKADIEVWLNEFVQTADYDETGNKYYFVFADKFRGGMWTLMNTNGQWSLHGKGEAYCDNEEVFIQKDEAVTFLWKHRAAVNKARSELKNKQPV